MKVEVQPYNPIWSSLYEVELSELREGLGSTLIRAHHIGSTAIPGIWAKPIVDIILEVRSIQALDEPDQPLVGPSYEAMGEYGIAGRRYFRKYRGDGLRSHHIHAYAVGSPEVLRHLAFRDFLLAHPDIAQQYSDLKRALAEANRNDMRAYVHGKEPFVREIERRALEWWRA